ncbi:type III-B CRISPR module RAMP protein Cmr1 [bacterium]|nr:MAG: type III-B CRISPR module RAMP protein Cmr1 [bacterium]
MKKVIFELETLTPLFMRGMDKNQSELRSPSFKGIIRYWWRAACMEDDLDRMKEREKKIFGGLGRAGIFWLKVKEKSKHMVDFEKKPGIRYLFFSMEGRRGNKGVKGIPPQSVFSLEFIFSKDAEEAMIEEALSSLFLAVYLGGFGARARRGGGNLVVKNVNGIENLVVPSFHPDENEKDYPAWLEENIQKALEKIGKGRGENFSYSSLKNASLYLYHMEKWKDWKEPLDWIGRKLQEFRMELKNQENLYANPPVVKRAAFGLPVNIRKRKKNNAEKVCILYKDTGRYASPLILKIHRADKKWYVGVLVMKVDMEGGVVVKTETGKERNVSSVDVEGILKEFVSFLEREKNVIKRKIKLHGGNE